MTIDLNPKVLAKKLPKAFWALVDAVKCVVFVVALVLIVIALVRAYGVSVPWFRMDTLHLAALAAAAAYVSR